MSNYLKPMRTDSPEVLSKRHFAGCWGDCYELVGGPLARLLAWMTREGVYCSMSVSTDKRRMSLTPSVSLSVGVFNPGRMLFDRYRLFTFREDSSHSNHAEFLDACAEARLCRDLAPSGKEVAP